MALKVLMVGGRRCGKTSVLAALFDQMTNGVVNQFFTVCDGTAYVTKENEKQDVLSTKSLELQNLLDNPTNNTFLVDEKPTNFAWKYSLKLQLPGTSKSMTMDFLDVPGEYWQASMHDKEIINFVGESDVYIVAIDTPYLMAEGASPVVFKAMNCITDIHGFLSNIDDSNGTKSKMVIFVPVKCETWVKEHGSTERLVQAVEHAYSAMIRALLPYPKMSVCIMPVQTAGNILFSEMKDAFVLNGGERRNRCCKVSESMVRMWNGQFCPLKPDDKLNLDNDAMITGTNIVRPYSWFHINDNATGDLYQPYNCEQLPLHILNFWLQKYKHEFDLWNYIKMVFGGISASDLQKKLKQIQDSGLIKENMEGIRYLKKAY